MSLMALGVKINALQKGIEQGRFSTKAQVKEAAKELNVALSAGYGNLSAEDGELWYEQLAVNLFEKRNNWVPCFIDIGFGKELVDHSSDVWNGTLPKKQHWKIIVTRDTFPEWQFCAIVAAFCREEAVFYLKNYFSDYGCLGFNYHYPSEIKQNVPWVEISTKKTGSYKKQLKAQNGKSEIDSADYPSETTKPIIDEATSAAKTVVCPPQEESIKMRHSIIVIGCGGTGTNIVDAMIESDMKDVDFAVIDTDKQKLSTSRAPVKILIGQNLTGGFSAGGKPELGEKAANESIERIKNIIQDAEIVFLTAGMGGGTGTGIIHVIAKAAHENGALVVASVTKPFCFEGNARMRFAHNGIKKLGENADSLITIENEHIKLVDKERKFDFIQALKFANNIPCQIVQMISELYVSKNKEFISSFLQTSGNTFFAVSAARGENNVKEAMRNIVSNVMLETSDITCASKLLLNIKLSASLSDKEQKEIIDYIKTQTASDVNIRSIISVSTEMKDNISVSVIAA